MFALLQGFFEGLRPIPIITVSEWADTQRYLTTESSAEPGLYRTDRTPYAKEIMDCFSPNSPVIFVVFMKSVQIGGTDMILNVLGCFMDISPCPILYVMPTLDLAKAISETRVDPMIDNSPSLRTKVREKREKDSGNTKYVKKYPGGISTFAGANSAASLRSRSARVVLFDETDAYPQDVDDEGSPIALGEKRAVTYGDRKKIGKISTPTTEGNSVIEREFDDTDQRYYHVPCPHCGYKQHLKFENLHYEKGDYDNVTYRCDGCAVLIEERFKTWMLAECNGAEWVPLAPEKKNLKKRGYHLNALYSPLGWLSWGEIIEMYEKINGDVNLEKTFTNTILAQTFKIKGDVPEWQNLYNRREKYAINTLNNAVCFLTAGVDVQGDRLELEIVGWCKGKITYSVDYRILTGDTSKKEVWDKLSLILEESWTREDGLVMPIKLMAVDSGYNTQKVYDFCRKYDATRVIPIKGRDNQDVVITAPKAVDVSHAGKKVGTVKVWNVGVSLLKSELYGWLRLEIENDIAPNGYCHFPEYGQEHFKGLTGEQLQFKTVDGYKKYAWVKKYERNEPLDCRNYARAAASVIGIDRFKDEHWLTIVQGYQKKAVVAQITKTKKDFWNGRNKNFLG